MNSKRSHLLLGFTTLIYAMFLLFILVNNFSNRTEEHWRFFYAFTQQSNIICLIWFLLFGLATFKSKRLYKMVTNNTVMTAITVYISITFFIVLFILDPVLAGEWNPLKSASELFLHDLTPVMVWMLFFLVKGNGSMKYRNSLLILIYPVIYFGANLFIGANYNYLDGTSAYAYNFVNPNNYGNLVSFAALIIGLIAVFAVFGLLLTKLKKYLNSL